MHSELDNITHLSRKHFNTIQKLTAPLATQFGVTYFARQTVSNDGHWEIVGNLPDWLDHSAAKEFYHVDPSLLHPDHYQSGLTVTSLHSAPDFLQDMARESLTRFDIDQTLCILKKTATGSEWYFFSAPSKHKNIITTYITQIHAFYKYIHYFNTQAKTLLQKNLDYSINISNLKNQPFHTNQHKIELAPFDIAHDDSDNLPAREKDCLRCLIQGKTIKETAKLLGISPRTVEVYLNRLKQKTGCRYKRELAALFLNKIL